MPRSWGLGARGWPPLGTAIASLSVAGSGTGKSALLRDGEREGTSEDQEFIFSDDFTFAIAGGLECSDTLDNDGDGLTDFDGGGVGGADPQCVDRPWKNREARRRHCGLGLELGFLLPPLLLVCRRRERGRP